MKLKLLLLAILVSRTGHLSGETLPGLDPQILSAGWQMQAAPRVAQTPETISQVNSQTQDWLPATVPTTVLTTLVNDRAYPEPL